MKWILWPLLYGLSIIYGSIVWIRNSLFDWGVFLRTDSGAVAVSIGNLSAGGTGKTPVVAFLARRWKSSVRLGVVSRGYGRISRGSKTVDPKVVRAALEFGDEPTWLSEEVKVPVQVAENRVIGAQDLVAKEGVRLVLIDDGFQHRWVARHVDLVLVDASTLEAEWALLPLGRLREPIGSLRRASAVFLTKSEGQSEAKLEEIEGRLRGAMRERAPIIRFRQTLFLPPEVAGKSVFLLAGIAKPQMFFAMVRSVVGAMENPPNVCGELALPDHFEFGRSALDEILRKVRATGAEAVIVTEKDAIKLSSTWKDLPLLVSRLEVQPARESDRRELERLDERVIHQLCRTDRSDRRESH